MTVKTRITEITESATLGKGKVFFTPTGENGAEDLLEVEDFKYNLATEKVEKKTSGDSSGALIASIVKDTKCNGSIVCLSPKFQVARFFDMAEAVTDVSQTTSSIATTFTARLGRWIDLGKKTLSAVRVRANSGKVFTADPDTEIFTSTAHGFLDGDRIYVVNSGGALPAGLVTTTLYYIVNKTDNTFQLSLTLGGTPQAITDAGTGTQTAYEGYVEDTDYELLEKNGKLKALVDGGIADAATIYVNATYATQTILKLEGATLTNRAGVISFEPDTDNGINIGFEADVKLNPNGDWQMIGDDLLKFTIDFECLLSANRNGLFTKYDYSGLSAARAAV